MDDNLLKLAQQAGFTVMDWGQIRIKHSNGSWVSVTEQLDKFARLVLAAAPSPAIAATDDARDAARYRHVREKPEMLLHLKNSEFDAAIDAAMGDSNG